MRHEAEREKERETATTTDPPPITIPAGQAISIRMIDSIDTKHNQEGETFRASLSSPITDGDRVIVPVGTSAIVLLAAARGAGRIKGQSELELRLTSLNYHGEPVQVSSSAYDEGIGARQANRDSHWSRRCGRCFDRRFGGRRKRSRDRCGSGWRRWRGLSASHARQPDQNTVQETEINFTLASPLVLNR